MEITIILCFKFSDSKIYHPVDRPLLRESKLVIYAFDI